MTRLQSELNRLYLPRPQVQAEVDARAASLIGPSNTVRAMVMELTRPPSWELLSKVWHGVQTELELPAPAIAVSGTDGLQLWFSLAEPIAAGPAHAFLERLRQRFLPDIEASRVRLMPASDAMAHGLAGHARPVPSLQEQTGNWSAFVAPDLAPVFAETPWLDIPPNEEGQASLLRGIAVMQRDVFEATLAKLAPATTGPPSIVAVAALMDEPVGHGRPAAAAASEDAKRFLLQVMNDDSIDLALRVEAAKALL